ncbi:hypothetical protein BJX76DRAFT_353270 [Aspergillus varians]
MTYIEPLVLYLTLYHYVNGPGATAVFQDPTQTTSTRIRHPRKILSPVRSSTFLSRSRTRRTERHLTRPTLPPPRLVPSYGPRCAHAVVIMLKAQAPRTRAGRTWTIGGSRTRTTTRRCAKRYGLRLREIFEGTWIFLSAGLSFLGRNREMSLDKIRSVGLSEEHPVASGYFRIFDHLAREKIIPGADAWTKWIMQAK